MNPVSSLPWTTPWRFIDYAADMNWDYSLVDALWDTQIGYDKMEELVDYAKTKNVEMLVWYNSNGSWNDAPQSPIHMLDTREKRLAEFKRLKKMGIAGMKIDFFGGDGSSMINYYIDLLEDAAQFDFLINFHGCTLPRGWQRTYPNLMTMEAIKGLEFIRTSVRHPAAAWRFCSLFRVNKAFDTQGLRSRIKFAFSSRSTPFWMESVFREVRISIKSDRPADVAAGRIVVLGNFSAHKDSAAIQMVERVGSRSKVPSPVQSRP